MAEGQEMMAAPPPRLIGIDEEDEEANVPEEEGETTNLSWTSSLANHKQEFLAIAKRVGIDKVLFDTALREGQSRVIDTAHVDHLKESIRLRPPLEPIRCLLWDNGSM